MYKDKSTVEDDDNDNVDSVDADVDLITEVGYIASRVRSFDKLYADFVYANPYGLAAAILDPDNNGCCLSSCCSPIIGRGTGAGVARSCCDLNITSRKLLIEDLLIKFYEDQEQTKRRRNFRENKNKTIIMNSSIEKLLPTTDDDDSNTEGTPTVRENWRNGSNVSNDTNSDTKFVRNASIKSKLSLVSQIDSTEDDNNKSDNINNQLMPFANDIVVGNGDQIIGRSGGGSFGGGKHLHRGSCGCTSDTFLGTNSIAKQSTIILSKSCNNVDGSSTALFSQTTTTTTNGNGRCAITDVSERNKQIAENINSGGMGSGISGRFGTNPGEYNLVQLKNTIIQCQFNNEDLRALVKDLKRKVEYTERMNWLCKLTPMEMNSLSRRPVGPPHRKSSLPKHSEVKKRFLEICDTTFSDEIKAALRLPAFDSYEWEDAAVIHLMQTMFIELGFIEKFNIPILILREWLYEVYKHYNEVPFHNFRHCFCVAQMMFAITRHANLMTRLGDLEVLILLVSCICHDLDHPGYNNIYQINARTELALRYNDISPLENHHCSIAFRLLAHPDCNIFQNFSRETFNLIREGIIRCILATDMARHNEILTQFKEVTPIFDYSNRSHINLLCMILIKVADISNEARPMDVAEPWLDRLLQEFFAQSAAEKSEGLPVTPFMDPDKVSKPGSQVRFIGLVLLPLFEALGELLPELIELIIIPVRVALDYYKRLNDAQNKSRKSIAETAETTSSDGGGLSPQLPRSQSGISVKSRRSIPSQKSASRTSVDEPTCIAAELHDLPEGSESGDSETATEVDVAEKTSKFKVDTEGSSNRSKSSHSTSRKSSREKRPSMVGEMCSTGSSRTRNSYGNIHGYHSSNRGHFGANRAVSLDQYSCNNRRLSSDGLQQVISDSNVFYNRNNRCSLDTDGQSTHLNMNERPKINETNEQQLLVLGEDVLNMNNMTNSSCDNSGSTLASTLTKNTTMATIMPANSRNTSTNGNCSANLSSGNTNGAKSWKARFKQISDYFSFNFDKGNKRFASTRSSPCSMRNNNAVDLTSKQGICCTISNNLSPNLKHKQELITAGRNRAYSLDVPTRNRYSGSSAGGDSRKSSRNEDNSNRQDLLTEDNNSNNTSSGEGILPMRINSVDTNDSSSILITTTLPQVVTPNPSDVLIYGGSICSSNIGGEQHNIDLGIPSGSSDPPKI